MRSVSRSVFAAVAVFVLVSTSLAADDTEIARLVRQLGDDSFDKRQAASKALDAIGEPALKELFAAARSDDLEVRQRAIKLIATISGRLRAATLADLERLQVERELKEEGPEVLVTQINLSGHKDTLTLLPRVSLFLELRRLRLRDSDVADEHLATLSGLFRLEGLYLARTKVTGPGLKNLNKLKALRCLDLRGTPLTDEGLACLAGLDGLEDLVLDGTRITDSGLAHLGKLKALRTLSLGRTGMTDAGLEEVVKLTALTSLDLDGTKITDAGLMKLGQLKALRSLDLSFTKVTDAGLAQLRGMKELREVLICDTAITDKGIAELSQAMPNLRIHRVRPDPMANRNPGPTRRR